MFENIFVSLYPFVGIISVTAYYPQIKSLLKASSLINGISIKSWSLWAISSVISLGYGIFNLKDLLFCLITVLSLCLTVFVIWLLLKNRYVQNGHFQNTLFAAIAYYLQRPFFAVAPVEQIKRHRENSILLDEKDRSY